MSDLIPGGDEEPAARALRFWIDDSHTRDIRALVAEMMVVDLLHHAGPMTMKMIKASVGVRPKNYRLYDALKRAKDAGLVAVPAHVHQKGGASIPVYAVPDRGVDEFRLEQRMRALHFCTCRPKRERSS